MHSSEKTLSKKKASRGVYTFFFVRNVPRNRAAIEAPKIRFGAHPSKEKEKKTKLPIDLQLAKRSNWQQSNADDRAVDTTIDSTSDTFDRHCR